MKSVAEEMFADAWAAEAPRQFGEAVGWSYTPVREHKFHPTRRWRFDFAWPSIKLAVEIDGRGRHHTVAGFRADCEKINEAIKLGWRVLRFPATDKKDAPLWVDTVVECMCPEA
jgi:very-short-patch-repair endonuclease